MVKAVVCQRGAAGLLSALVAVCTMAAFLSAPSSADELASRTSATPLTVATFNVLSERSGVAWKPRRARVLKLIKRSKADVIVLQEADAPGDQYYVPPLGAKPRNLPSPWLARKSGMALAPMYGFVEPGYPSKLRYTRKGPHILYRPGRVSQLDAPCDQDHLNETGWATFTDRSSGRVFRLATVHLQAGTTRSAARTRASEVSHLTRYMKSCNSQPGRASIPTIWAGDFNASNDRRIARSLRRLGLVDTVKIATKRTHHRINTYKGRGRAVVRKGVRIDQIWVPRGSRVSNWTQVVDIKKGKYVGRLASDHNPVAVRVTLPA